MISSSVFDGSARLSSLYGRFARAQQFTRVNAQQVEQLAQLDIVRRLFQIFDH